MFNHSQDGATPLTLQHVEGNVSVAMVTIPSGATDVFTFLGFSIEAFGPAQGTLLFSEI